MNRWKRYNPNPMGRQVGDCTVRAVSRVLDLPWWEAYLWLCLYGFALADMPTANHVWGAFLKNRGFRRAVVDDSGDRYTVLDFCVDHPYGRYVLALSGHVIAVVDGCYYDSWDSGDEIPTYYWYRSDD